MSDPRLAGSAGSDESLGEGGLPDPFPEPGPLPEGTLEPPPVPELTPPAELSGDVPQSPPVDSELSLDELMPAPPAPAGLPEMEVPGRP